MSSCKEFSECCATISSIAKANRGGSSRDRAAEGRGMTGGGRGQAELQARQTNNTHEQQQQHTQSTVYSLQLLRCLGALPMHSARLFCRLFCARFFSRERERQCGRGGRKAWQLAGGVLHIKFLSLCHVYRRRRRASPPAGSRHQIGCFSTEMQHLFRVACCISFAYLAPKLQCTLCPPLCAVAVGRKSPSILFIMSP